MVEYIQVAHSILGKHGPDKSATALPHLAIGCEDAVAEQRAPNVVKLFALAELTEFRTEDRFDVFWFCRE